MAKRSRERRLKAMLIAGMLVLFGTVAVAVYFGAGYWSPDEYEGDLQPTEEADIVPQDAAVYVPAIVDLAGDPMWINLAHEAGGETKRRSLSRPADLVEDGISPSIEYLSDTMLSSSERFMTAIPSTQEDFAFFQAQRAVAEPVAGQQTDVQPAPPAASDLDEIEPESDDASDLGAGWGETIDQGEAALPAFEKTAVENNTSVATVTPETERFEATEDVFVKILTNRTLESVALEARFASDEAKLVSDALKTVFERETLEPGYVVALRGFRPRRGAPEPALMQVSVYAMNRFIGTLARNAAGQFVSGVDPWVRDDLFNYSGAPQAGAQKRQYRLLDAIYSTAARNNVPTGVLGEALMYLSRGQDLNAFASEDQRLVLLYSETARGKDGVAGRVLYVGVHGTDKKLECFVFQQSDGQFSCVSGDDQVRSLATTNGMVTPVNGVMTSTFGPRKHPILKTVRIHKGVDWAAPIGTPIAAAFDGQVVFEGDGKGYGNLIRISHANNRETRYAHMQRFADGISVGTTVKAGDVIGYIGTTGLSTGPHLHFELYQDGQAIDPLGTVTVAVATTTTTTTSVGVTTSSDDTAIEVLTNRIIHVESGGRARAKNPLSSATGLGQFISKTWIRMMNTYRPDLARSLSTAELLELRFDPTISREMVRNLAREGESYLKQRGHQITAGRLYLCHFLGMEGAHQILSASGDAMIADVLGAIVIKANPFLTGKNASYVVAWAEKKMTGRAPAVTSQPSTPTPVTVRQTSPEFERYKQAIATTLNSVASTL
ncbi:murein DD-endopeptidase MepM/ murein hydrolase activator NlpD [Aminobacter lissarensis]|uniref:Murein DD-endopeptidase MepM/ murein hydrolase activator NlpD n=2 Tax=Aminobacter carboxidus TaxID=376165 RepID=A0A8E1WCX6_9HYPH|nr:murein DD-endopeptidase MepM/ murein hydrolase activator NlpD [Aminobacter lissarensis]